MPRRSSGLAALFCALLLCTSAAASTGGTTAPAPGTGGHEFGQASGARKARLRASFSITTAAPVVGGPATVFAFQVRGRPRRVNVRIDLLRADGSVVRRVRLGARRTERTYSVRVRLPERAFPAGAYVARLLATDRSRGARAAQVRSSLTVAARPITIAPPSAGSFPVQGPYSLGGAESRFGAEREGHSHQGHDISAAEGTPIVAPRAGVVHYKAYQRRGAGFYLVIRGDDGRDYVFMHLRDRSPLLPGQRVPAGARVGDVGATGTTSSAPHLHFEIWPNGWWAEGAQPIDPLPDLLAWAA